MIKETDASKNDERRVKNKLNPLTHKRKGETRTMSIQGTKHWQLGMFFVVSLMLMAGLFSSESYAALAGTVKVEPASVTAGETVDLRITYTSTTTLAVDDPAFVKDQRGTIQIMLPADLV